jgi:sortase (surface protein transpeptidase)
MAKIELDESTAASQAAVVKLVDDLVKSPKHRQAFLAQIKDIRPDVSIPEIDVAAPIQAELEALKTAQAEFFAEQRRLNSERDQRTVETSFVSEWNQQKNALLDAGYMSGAVEQIDQFAREQKIPNLEAAALLYEKRNPPRLSSGSGRLNDLFNPGSDQGQYTKNLIEARLKGGKAAMNMLMDQEITKTLEDVRSQNRRF